MDVGVRLRRLAEVRGVDAGLLARQAGVAETEIAAVLGGRRPDPALIRRLAPALGLHRSDLFVIADLDVPDDLAPLDWTAEDDLGWLSWSVTYLPGAIAELRELVRSLPAQPPPPGPRPPLPSYRRFPSGAGGLIVRLLQNRNLNWLGSAKLLVGVGRGDALSASTIGVIGRGDKELTPRLLAGFAALLDISARDLAAVTGIDPTSTGRPAHPYAAEAAALIWDTRRLTADQVRQVHDRARAIGQERGPST